MGEISSVLQGEALGSKTALQSQALKGRNNRAIEAVNVAHCAYLDSQGKLPRIEHE